MSITKHFVTNNNIPEYIKSDHKLYESFVEAYYEWLELQNDSESSSYADVFKAVGNPAYVVNNQEIIPDIDATIDEFIDHFAAEVVPISLEGCQTNPRFFMKKIRDLYLAKGSTKSFKLFFKLYYNDDIDVFETRDTVLRASDGKYLSFPTAHFYIENWEENLADLDFTLAVLYKDGVEVGTVLSGQSVDRTADKEAILKLQFTYDVELEAGASYIIRDAEGSYPIKIKPLVTLSSITLKDGGSLYNNNDIIYIQSKGLDKTFYATVSSTEKGYVQGLKIRDKGMYYSTGDRFEFSYGGISGSTFKPTEVDTNGTIKKINNIDLRTGPKNTGWLANNLEDVFVPIVGSNTWDNLPDITYRRNKNANFDGLGDPYFLNNDGGEGFQAIPVSTSIGVVKGIELAQETYFKDSDDVLMNAPATVVVENCNLQIGQRVAFQTFNASAEYGPFTDDSEELEMKFFFHRVWNHRDGVPIPNDSEITIKTGVTIPYSFDSENFIWKTTNVSIDTQNTNLWENVLALFDSESNLSVRTVTETAETGVDGGLYYGVGQAYDSDITGTGDFEDSEISDIFDGGSYFAFAKAQVNTLTVTAEGAFLNKLEEYHYELLDQLAGMDSDISGFKYSLKSASMMDSDSTQGYVNKFQQNGELDAGTWEDTGHYGEITAVDANNKVVKLISYNSNLPIQEELDQLSEEKYHVVILAPLDENDVSFKHTGLPLKNVVHQIDRMDIEFKTSTSSDLFKRFWTQDGFISSSYGGTIQDNYYYSDWSYRIRSKLPFDDWKHKFKTMLHPAGMVLTSEYTQNMNDKGLEGTADLRTGDVKPYLTFDANYEYVDPNPSGSGLAADNIYFKSNAFEKTNVAKDNALSADASVQLNVPRLAYKQQSGNAFWDYEPIGWVRNRTNPYPVPTMTDKVGNPYIPVNYVAATMLKERLSTQDSDVNGYIQNNYHYYKFYETTKQNFYKNNSRTPVKGLMISKVQFEDASFNDYSVYDSELPVGFMMTFADSEKIMNGIDYDSLKLENETRKFPYFTVPRHSELVGAKERDFLLAMREDGSLTFDDSDDVYTDYEAYEVKWNTINNRRDRNNEGYTIKGAANYVGYEHVYQRNKKRNKDFVNVDNRQYSRVNAPFNRDVWAGDTVVWNKHYYDQINIHNIKHNYDSETFYDPQVSMRSRRGR